MSIMRLESMEYGRIDSRYIQTIDLTIQNLSDRVFDVLVQAHHPTGVFYVTLRSVPAFNAVNLTDLYTEQLPFSLLLVTNVNNLGATGILLQAKQAGSVVAVYTQEDFQRLH